MGLAGRAAAGVRAKLRNEIATGLTGATQLGFSWLGIVRARPCRVHSIDLARAVHACYLLDPDTAGAIAAPAADALIGVLPETWLERLAAGLPPANAAGTLMTVFSQCRENERLLIARWNEQQARSRADQNGRAEVPDPAPFVGDRPSDYVSEE